MKWNHYTKSQSVVAQLSQQLHEEQVMAHKCLMVIISTLQFIGRQSLAARSHDESEGLFLQLLILRSNDCSYLGSLLQRHTVKTRMLL